ncbi:pyridoxamine 5'-phosphate oxidase family protein [Pendulispora albinea]|uniref:Pyridoxamine 5'-phosphate oxidase family protein n=1 Tax=Pendulispora albinea TaxID=2741071 RepID=A0ABZ2LVU6_9BACT
MAKASSFAATSNTTLHRIPARGSYDRALAYAILDEGLHCSVGIVSDGRPFVMPMAYARVEDELILHGASASRLLKTAGSSLAVCVTVTLLDGLVFARSAFHHSMNYRSVVVLGQAVEITDPLAKARALDALVEHVLPGRSRDVRPGNDKELAATRVLALPIEEASVKVRAGGPIDDEEDMDLACWAGDVPLALQARAPIDDAQFPPKVPRPAVLDAYSRKRR